VPRCPASRPPWSRRRTVPADRCRRGCVNAGVESLIHRSGRRLSSRPSPQSAMSCRRTVSIFFPLNSIAHRELWKVICTTDKSPVIRVVPVGGIGHMARANSGAVLHRYANDFGWPPQARLISSPTVLTRSRRGEEPGPLFRPEAEPNRPTRCYLLAACPVVQSFPMMRLWTVLRPRAWWSVHRRDRGNSPGVRPRN